MRLLERDDFSIDLLLTDVVMPQMFGEELAHTTRSMHPDPKVLFASGYTRDAIMRDDWLEAGSDLITKPFTYAALAAEAREVLRR
ncbi:DNA-binding response OmpR family regulator [Sphingomonas kyeonggiensis]|uniref:response regulator n=1 Tax=Sphingomonas kyeonggiensis TaxID=1268553 RepID=UPI0027857BCE|nr:response regulator [Sphingomonas kyeonggiensis]MDQ0252375.1 DNA-binding response OmpR family regulator [Sphingomonas kyeonggiensis]